MYSIFAGGNLVYEDVIQDMNAKVASPKLVLEDSSPGSLEFDLPPTNDVYDTITRYKDRVAVKRADSFIWYGRVAGDNAGINGMRHIYCEGALAILNDTIQPRAKCSTAGTKATVLENYLDRVITAHNNKVGSLKQFKFGGVKLGSQGNASSYAASGIARWTCYEKTLDVFSAIRDETGWHIIVDYSALEDKYVIRLLDDAAIDLEVAERQAAGIKHVDYRKNLVDISVEYDISSIASVVLPLGSAKEGSNEGDPEEPLTIPANYLDDDPQRKIRVYEGNHYYIYDSRIWCTEFVEGSLDGWISVSGDDVFESKISVETNDIANLTDKYETLVRAGMQFLHEHRPETASYTIQAVDGYYAGIDVSHVALYDRVNLTYPVIKNGKVELGVLSDIPVLALDIPIDSPGSTIYTLNKLPGEQISGMTSLSTRNDIGGLQTSVDGLQSGRETDSSQITDLDDQVESLENDVNGLKSRATSLESDVSSLKTRATNLESDVSGLKSRATSLESRATALEAGVDALLYTKSGTTIHTLNNVSVYGWCGTDGNIFITASLPKTIPSNSTVTITKLTFRLRSSEAKRVQTTSDYDALANSTVTVNQITGNTIRIQCAKTTAWEYASADGGGGVPAHSIVDGTADIKFKVS